MSQEKKLVLFFAIVFLWMIGDIPDLAAGWVGSSPPRSRRRAAAKDAEGQAGLLPRDRQGRPRCCRQSGDAEAPMPPRRRRAVKAEAEPAGAKPGKERRDRAGQQSELVLGSTKDRGPGAIAFASSSSRRGRASTRSHSALYDAEFEFGKPRKRPLEFISRDPKTPPSLALTLGDGAELRQGRR